MAAPVLTLAPMAVDVAYDDLTTITGGNSATVGYTGANWVWFKYSMDPGFAKAQGGSNITVSTFNDTGSVPTITSGSYRTKTYEAGDAAVNGVAGNAAGSDVTTAAFNIPASQINTGIRYSFSVDQNLRTFVWPGALAEGTYTVTATLADGSAVTPPITLVANSLSSPPFTAGDAWFKCTCRTVQPTTLTIEIRRTVATASVGVVLPQVAILQVPVAPAAPRLWKNYLIFLGLFGASN